MPAIRPLPSRPSLEYARKEAKALLRRLHAGDAEAVARAQARHTRIDLADPTRIRLAAAQLVVAREHGFASWPRLVRYIREAERQQHGHAQLHRGLDHYEREARVLLGWHAARRAWGVRAFAAYVPRFYGLSPEEVGALTPTDDEARLAVARGHGAPSWEVFLERLEADSHSKPADPAHDPLLEAVEAMKTADPGALERLVAGHPEFLHPSEYDISAGRTLMALALGQERLQGAAVLRPIMDWLEARGFSRQRELNLRLCGHGIGIPSAADVRALLEQGADPSWVPPNGIPVLEHALLRYRNGEAVDVLAAHTRPRKALWIAAGLGDVEGVRGFLDERGRPTRAGRRLRPDFIAVGGPQYPPPRPDADDEEILVEALIAAIQNGRAAVIEYLAARGAPLNSLTLGVSIVHIAIGDRTEMLECLVRCGADLDLGSDDPNAPTPRQFVRAVFEQAPDDPWRRRLVAACGMDADALLAEIEARPKPGPDSN